MAELYKTLPIPIPLRGLCKDAQGVHLTDMSPNMKNMIVELDRLRKRLGYTQFGINLPMAGIGMELVRYTDGRGNDHNIALTTTNAYEYNSTNDTWVHLTPSDDLDECEAGWTKGTGDDVVSHDTTYKIRGAKSMKIVLAAERSDGNLLAYKDISSTDIDAHNNIGFWIRADSNLAASALEVVVSESNHASGEKTGTYVECLATALTADTWTFVQLAKTLTDFNAVISVSIFANATLASGLIVYLEDIRAYTPFTGGADNRWSHCDAYDVNYFSNNGGGALLISNGVDSIFYYEGQSGDDFQALDVSDFASFANADEIEEFWNHFWTLNYNDGGQHVKAIASADIGNIDSWIGGTSSVYVLTDSIGEIIRAKKLGADIVIYSENSISLGSYLGQPTIFMFPTLIYETGLFAPKAIWDFVNIHYLLGTDQKIYAYTGTRQLKPIGFWIEKWLFGDIDASKKARIVSGLDPARHQVHFFYPTSSDTYAKQSVSLSYDNPDLPWEYHQFADTVRDFSIFSNEASWYCDGVEVSGDYCDDSSLYCDASHTQSGYAVATFITHDGYVFKLDEANGQDDDADIECILDLADVSANDAGGNKEEEYLRINRLTFEAKSVIASATVNTLYSSDDGATWTSLESNVSIADAAANTWAHHIIDGFDVSVRKFRVRFQQDSTKDFQIRGCKCRALVCSHRD